MDFRDTLRSLRSHGNGTGGGGASWAFGLPKNSQGAGVSRLGTGYSYTIHVYDGRASLEFSDFQ